MARESGQGGQLVGAAPGMGRDPAVVAYELFYGPGGHTGPGNRVMKGDQ